MNREPISYEALAKEYGNERYSMIIEVLRRAGVQTDSADSQTFLSTLAENAAKIKEAAEKAGYHYGDQPAMVGESTAFNEALTRIGQKMINDLSPVSGELTPAQTELRRQRAQDLVLNLLKTLVVDDKTADYQRWKEHLLPDPKKPRSQFGTQLS